MDIKVAIFEDNKSLLDTMHMLINGSLGFTVCGVYSDAVNAVEKLRVAQPDVVLMDIEMPGIDGITATQLIKSSFPDVSILIQTVFEDDEKVFSALCAGASGYLLKNTSPAKILESLKEVYDGGSPMSPVIAKKVITSFHKKNTPGPAPLQNLTERETHVLNALVKGNSYKLIADELNITYGTVHSHIKNIYKKLHVNSMGEAISKTLSHKER